MSKAIVIGGGFYGSIIAIYLKNVRGLSQVTLYDQAEQLLTRSSFANQARIHNGYHYPRSYTTAYRSVANAPRFIAEFGPAVVSDFTSLYALARRNSQVTPRQMERFCREVGAPLMPAPAALRRMFNPRTIDRVYLTQESQFNANLLREIVMKRLREAAVEVRLCAEVQSVTPSEDFIKVQIESGGESHEVRADVAFNCTYSRLQTTLRGTCEPAFGLKHEITEMVLMEPPQELAGLGVTVMDGPFFSFMPFPPRGLHSLSHVRYTPHLDWIEDCETDPYQRLGCYKGLSRADRMLRDAARYLPGIARGSPVETLREVKTVLKRNDGDDGRPILLHRGGAHGRLFSVLGGKIDNVYDILEMLDDEPLPAR